MQVYLIRDRGWTAQRNRLVLTTDRSVVDMNNLDGQDLILSAGDFYLREADALSIECIGMLEVSSIEGVDLQALLEGGEINLHDLA